MSELSREESGWNAAAKIWLERLDERVLPRDLDAARALFREWRSPVNQDADPVTILDCRPAAFIAILAITLREHRRARGRRIRKARAQQRTG